MCTLFVHAQAQCNAAFTYTISNNFVYFNAVDSSLYASSWAFGDGTTGWSDYTMHEYSAPGIYTVKHVVIDTLNNCRDSSVQNISVQFTPGCTASFSYFNDSTHLDQYSFYDASTIIGSNYLNSQWLINGAVLDSNSQSFSYTFTQTGTYHVCEQIQTSSGCASSSCRDILVANVDSCNLNASFTYTAGQSNPFAIAFSPATDTGTNISYSWYFGDGTYDSTKNPVHVFSKGIYYVSLNIQKPFVNTVSCTANYSAPVYINIGPADTCSIGFSYIADTARPNAISFIQNSGQTVASEEWSIYKGWDSLAVNGGALALLQNANPTYSFSDTGYYFITLKITTQVGCISYTSSEIYIDSVAPGAAKPNSIAQMPAYPNPAANNVNLNIPMNADNNITINIYTAMGNLIITQQFAGTAGNNQITIPVQTLQSGVYYMEINYGNQVKRSRFQKL